MAYIIFCALYANYMHVSKQLQLKGVFVIIMFTKHIDFL